MPHFVSRFIAHESLDPCMRETPGLLGRSWRSRPEQTNIQSSHDVLVPYHTVLACFLKLSCHLGFNCGRTFIAQFGGLYSLNAMLFIISLPSRRYTLVDCEPEAFRTQHSTYLQHLRFIWFTPRYHKCLPCKQTWSYPEQLLNLAAN